MKKFFIAGLVTISAVFASAEIIDINGTFKPDAGGKPDKWTFREEKSGGKMEYTPGTPNKVKLVSGRPGYVTFLSKNKISSKIGDKYKFTLKTEPKKAVCVGFYLHTPQGGYITGLQRSTFANAAGTAVLELTIIDPTKRGFEVGSVIPFIKAYNGTEYTLTEVILEKTPAAAGK